MIGRFWRIACSLLPNNVFFFSKRAWLTFLLFAWLLYSQRLEILEYLPPLCQVLMDQEFIIATRTLLEKPTFKYFPSFSTSKLGFQVIFPDYFLIVPYNDIKKKPSKTWLSFPLQTSFLPFSITSYFTITGGMELPVLPCPFSVDFLLLFLSPGTLFIVGFVLFCFLDTSFLIPG